jgi:hypothetical protein
MPLLKVRVTAPPLHRIVDHAIEQERLRTELRRAHLPHVQQGAVEQKRCGIVA